ncbi:hypothetical protein Hanom_Chr03g00211831 [Helianthus anomalus]
MNGKSTKICKTYISKYYREKTRKRISLVYCVTHGQYELTLTNHLASNISLPVHLCNSKSFLKFCECHSHHQSVSGHHRFPESNLVYSSKDEIFTGPTHFWLQHYHTPNLCHCLQENILELQQISRTRDNLNQMGQQITIRSVQERPILPATMLRNPCIVQCLDILTTIMINQCYLMFTSMQKKDFRDKKGNIKFCF